MKIDLEDLRRQYGNLNDDALLGVDRDELTPLAQQVYDAEVASRGLKTAAAEGDEDEEAGGPGELTENLMALCSFADPTEAGVARSLLRQADIPCFLSSDMPLAGSVFATLSEVTLYVPAGYEEQANEVLDSEISDEELAAQAEAAAAEFGEHAEREEHAEEQE